MLLADFPGETRGGRKSAVVLAGPIQRRPAAQDTSQIRTARMSVRQSDFTPQEWALLRTTPHLVAAAVASAGRSGLIGTLKEALAACQRAYAGQAGASPLVQELSTPEEVKAGQAAVRELVPLSNASTAAEQLRLAAVQNLSSALQLLDAKQLAAESSCYGQWVMEIATAVAQAAKEGAFLGLGGKRVSDAEAALLAELAQVRDSSHPS